MRICLVAVILFGVSACVKENTSTVPLNERNDTLAITVYKGTFLNGPHGTVQGISSILKTGDKFSVSLENFTTTNGPDLKVYLSQEQQPIHFYNLGSLRSTNGNQVYIIPSRIDPASYSYVLIHCQQYNHLFGYASFK